MKVGFIHRYTKKIQVMLFILVHRPVLWTRSKEATPVGVLTLGPQTSNGASICYSRDYIFGSGKDSYIFTNLSLKFSISFYYEDR